MKVFFIIVFISSVIIEGVIGMSEKQLVAAVKMVKNVCQPKTKAVDEDIKKMHEGDWNIDHTAMCYVQCALNMYKLIDKDNTFNYDSAMAQLKQVPDRYRAATEKCANQCKESAVTLDDKCVAAYEIAKCIYFCSPEDYYLP